MINAFIFVNLANMRTRKKFLPFLVYSVLSLIVFMMVINFLEPLKDLPVLGFGLHPLLLFFVFLFLTVYFLSSYILLSRRRGVLVSVFILTFFILRFLNINNLLYLILVMVILLLIEWLYSK